MASPLTFATGSFNSIDGAAVSGALAVFVPAAAAAGVAIAGGATTAAGAAAGVEAGAGEEGATGGAGAGLHAGSKAMAVAAIGERMAAER